MSSPQVPPQTTPPSWTTHLSDSANVTSALKWGVIVAAAYIVLGLLLTLLANAIASVGGADFTKNPAYIVPSCLSIFVAAFGFYVAGYLPANERGNIATGIAGVVVMMVLITIEGIIQGTSRAGTGSIAVQIVGIVLDLAIGLGIGWVGAFYGVKRRVKVESKA